MDALQSFVHLNDCVPSWLSKLDDLTVNVAEHNARFIEMARFGNNLLKKKNLSTESLRGDPVHNSAIGGETATTTTGAYVPPDPSHQCLSHAARARNAANNIALVRKRKGSNSSLISEQPRYRTKSMVVVYYDSAVQEAFESLFRSIASARNNLRKGKIAATFRARMASLDTSESSVPAIGDPSTLTLKTMKVGLGRRTRSPAFGADDKTASFDEADKDLETSQNLCEVAAHQFLRDGDCRLEIDGMRKKFENCGAIAKREVERLKEEEAREQEMIRAPAELVQEEPLPVIESVEAKVNPPPPLKEINFPVTGVIEVDDGYEAESVQIDLSAFKTRTMRPRRSPLMGSQQRELVPRFTRDLSRCIVLSDSEPDLDDDSDEFTDDANTTKRCPSHLSSKTKPGTSSASDNFNYNNLHGASRESNDDTLSAISNTKNSCCRNATTRSDNAAPGQTGGSKTLKRKADMGGIDPDNIITPSLRSPNESELSKSDHRRPRKSQRLTRGHGGSTVSYDMKHHPMDDILRPKYSAKRRGNQRQAAEEPSDSDGEIGEDNEIGTPSKIASPNPHYRRSSRGVHLSNRPIYSAKWHPMDQMLKDNATSTRVLKGGDRNRDIRKSIESSPTLKGDEDSSTISLDLHPNHDGDRASELEGRIIPISPGQRRSARVSSSKNRPPNYDMKYHVMDSILRPQAARKRIESRIQSATSSKKFIKSSSSIKPQANHPARSPPKSLAGRSVGHGSGLAVPVAPTWSQLQNPDLSRISLNWNEIHDMDRCMFLLQKGAPVDSDTLPQDWTSDVFEKYLLDEGIYGLVELSSRDKVELLKNRYETVRLGLQNFFNSEPEPTNKNCWTLSKTEGFNVYRLKSGSRYWKHQKDSIVEGTTSSISANVMGSTPEMTKHMVGNRNQEATDSISEGQAKLETKMPANICNVTNEGNRPNKPCLKLSPVMDVDTERTTNLDREDDSERGTITETEDTLIESMRGDHSVFSITSDAALEELLLPAEQSMIEDFNREVAADLISRAPRCSEPARTVVTHPDQTLSSLTSVGLEAKAIGLKTSSTHRLAEAAQINMENFTSGDIIGPRGKSDKPQTPETQPKARKRKSGAGFTVLVHEDLPGRTPLIKKMVRMNPVSPGTDIPKENLEDDGLVEDSSQVEMGIPQTRRRRTNETIDTPSIRRVHHLGSATTIAPPYRSLFQSPGSSRMARW